MAGKDFYEALGVKRDATAEQIRKAFKKIARENHPDAKPNDPTAAERFKEAAEAYDVLGDPEKRKKYDQFGADWKHFKEGQRPYPGGGPFRSGGPVEIDLRDLFGGGGAVDLEELFGGMFGGGAGGRTRGPRSRQGQDSSTSIEVPFQTAAVGGNYELSLHATASRIGSQSKFQRESKTGKPSVWPGRGNRVQMEDRRGICW